MGSLSHSTIALYWAILLLSGAILGGLALPALRRRAMALSVRLGGNAQPLQAHRAGSIVAGTAAGLLCAACLSNPYQGASALVLLIALIALAWIDLDTRLLPDFLTLPLLLIGLLLNGLAALFATPAQSVAGTLLAYAVLWMIATGYRKMTGTHGLGGGDIKLAAGLGAWLGWQQVPALLLLASILSVLAWLPTARGGRRDHAFAFGPCLAIAGLALLMMVV